MATPTQWLEGARPRTLFMALAPVVAGTGAAAAAGSVRPGRAALALAVALALQIAVNYANDYSDGVRGTDANRVGPQRLVGSGVASPRAVLTAAVAWFAVAGVAGLLLAALVSWWLLLVGGLSIMAAWAYTGSSRPYGYLGLGELAVFLFFGVVAVAGTAYVQIGSITATAMATSVPIGLLAAALLIANNLRDIPGDRVVGKRTLAVRLGDHRSRLLYATCVIVPFALPPLIAVGMRSPWPLAAFAALPLTAVALHPVVRGAVGADLIPTLRHTGQLSVGYAILLAIGLGLSQRR